MAGLRSNVEIIFPLFPKHGEAYRIYEVEFRDLIFMITSFREDEGPTLRDMFQYEYLQSMMKLSHYCILSCIYVLGHDYFHFALLLTRGITT